MVEVHAVYMMDDFDCMYFNMNSSKSHHREICLLPAFQIPLHCIQKLQSLWNRNSSPIQVVHTKHTLIQDLKLQVVKLASSNICMALLQTSALAVIRNAVDQCDHPMSTSG